MKVCYYAWSSYTRFSIEIHRELVTRGLNYSAAFVVNNTNEAIEILNAFPTATTYIATTFIEENRESFTYERFISLEQKYKIYSLWSLILCDRFLKDCSFNYAIKIGAGYLSFFEMVFEKEQPAFFVNEVIAVYSSYAAYYVGLANNVKYITPMVTRTHDATHHYFVSDPFQLNINFNPNYKSDLPDNKYLLKAKNYLKEFETKSLKPNLMAFTGAKPKLSMSFIKSFYFFLKEYLNPPNKSDYINRYNYKTHINPIIFYLRYQIMKRYFKVDNPNLKKKYVFVPLHYQPEAATLVCAEKYEKQLFLLDSLAKSIPADTVIYVKEHYALLGHKQISFYKEIIKYPNIFLVNPWFDSHLLIKNAEAVVALTGTAGFEAVLYRKPVILLGRIFYENAPGIIQLEDIYGSYKKALASWRQPTREEIELYLAECFRTMYEGCVYTIVPEVFLTDNIKRVADSLLKQFVRLIN